MGTSVQSYVPSSALSPFPCDFPFSFSFSKFSFLNLLTSYSIFKICILYSITQNSPLRILESGSVFSYTPGEFFDHKAAGQHCLLLFLKIHTLQSRATSSLEWEMWGEGSYFTMYVSLCTCLRGRKHGLHALLRLLSVFIPVIY